MLRFREVEPEKGKKSKRYVVVNTKAKKNPRLGKIVRKRKYEFIPHPKATVSKTNMKKIDAFIEGL